MIDSLITVMHYVIQLTNVVNILHDTFTNYTKTYYTIETYYMIY